MEKVVIASAVRTAVGGFGGTLKDIGDTELGALVVGEAVKRAGISPEDVDETIMATGYRTGELPINAARVWGIKGGMPIEKTQLTICKACGGSIRSVTLAAQIIKAGDADIMCAGGVESMSNAAYLLRQARWGYRLGHGQLQDQLILFDPLSGDTMGETAENVAEKYQISREDQDAFGLESQTRAAAAIAAGKFKDQIVPWKYLSARAIRLFSIRMSTLARRLLKNWPNSGPRFGRAARSRPAVPVV
jgi:acetyl-CoA C-acetyltransferase